MVPSSGKKNGGSSIDAKGTGDPFCVPFVPDRNGLFYFTIISSAPQFTDHNDVWFKFTASVVIYRPASGSRMRKAGWMKGFQNKGERKKADYVLTKDHDGHQIFLEGLQPGIQYKACVAGRSSKFKLYNFVLISCQSLGECDRMGRKVRSEMSNLPAAAKCV